MQYRPYGKHTNIQLSALAFGALRLPKDDDLAVECMTSAVDLGVNYIDTAWGYMGGHSEELVGRALKCRPREELYVSTKNAVREETDAASWREQLEVSLTRMDTDYVDFYKIFHMATWERYSTHFKPSGGCLDAALQARDEGLIRHLSFSSHDKQENVIRLIDEGIFDSLLVQYNLLDRVHEPTIAHAAEAGMAVFIMGPVGGGRLGMSSEKINDLVPDAQSTPELALRFVLSNTHVTSALSGMSTIEMVEENCATVSRPEPLSDDERAAIEVLLDDNKRLSDLYCTGCNYCMPCPHGVGIPQAFSAMNMHRVWGLTDVAKSSYARLGPENREGLLQADACVECGECEGKCPQDIPIIEQLKETHAALSE